MTPDVGYPSTLRDALSSAEQLLAEHGVASPRHDAEELAAHLLHTTRIGLINHLDEPPPPALGDLVGKRATRVPLQHLTGCAHFRHLTLAVGPGVFIPRPETEVVVDHALTALATAAVQRPRPVAVDLCAGSGAIAASLAVEAPFAEIHAVEADPAAIIWLTRNVADLPVQIHAADLCEAMPGVVAGVDVVVSNPPYIPSGSVPRDLEVAKHDPPVALYSGDDGLDHIRQVEQVAARLLRPHGWVLVEHADEQATSAPGVFLQTGHWDRVVDHRDLNDRPRIVVARRVGDIDAHP